MANHKTITPGPEHNSPLDELACDDLAWLAFRYHVGELSADEAEAFEEELFVDQASREALAEVVAMAEAVDLTRCLRQEPFDPGTSKTHPTPAQRSNSQSPGRLSRWPTAPINTAWINTAWINVGLAASLGLILAGYGLFAGLSGQSRVVKVTTPDQAAVAQVWASTKAVQLEDVHPNGLAALPFEGDDGEFDPAVDPAVDPASLVPVFPNLYLAKSNLMPADVRKGM